MKFNMSLSVTDLDSQRKLLEELFSAQAEGSCSINKESLESAIKIFEKTFTAERCPNCEKGLLEANHLRYYNIIIKRCDYCPYTINISRKTDESE